MSWSGTVWLRLAIIVRRFRIQHRGTVFYKMRGFSLLIEEVLAFQVTPDTWRILVRNGKIFMAFLSQTLSLYFY